MDERPLNILLIETEPDHARQLGAALDRAADPPIRLIWVERLAEALARIDSADTDAVLIAVGSPGEPGAEAIGLLHARFPALPIVALAERDDDALARRAIELGARHFLVRGQIEVDVIARALRSALARRRIQADTEQAQQQDRHEQEIDTVERVANRNALHVTAQLFGSGSLRETAPADFAELVERYAELLDLALDQRLYRVEHNVPQQLRSLADQLGMLRANPRDIVEIHGLALRRKMSLASRSSAQALVEEGRLIVLELMGHLVSFYRSYALGARPPHGGSAQQ